MNTNKKFQTAPIFSWPNSNEISADFGALDGFCLSKNNIDGEFMNSGSTNNQPTGVVPITPIKQYFPHTRRYDQNLNIHRNIVLSKSYFTQNAEHMHNVIPEFDIPLDFLAETFINESIIEEEYHYTNDSCMGSQLISICDYRIVDGQPLQLMIFPMGIAGSELCMIPLKKENNFHDSEFKISQLELDLSNSSRLNLKTPIRQVTTSISEKWLVNKLPGLMAVRTMTGTIFFEFTKQSNYKPIVMDVLVNNTNKFYEHMHVAFNPVLYGEAAIIDKYDGVYIWRAERSISTREFEKSGTDSIHLPSPQTNKPLSKLWKACEYGAHPQSLLAASRTNINFYDFREKVESPNVNLYNVKVGENIYAFQRFPMMNSFQTIFSTDNDINILDQRFPKRPLIRCAHHFNSHLSGFNIIVKKNDFLQSKYLRTPDLTQLSHSYYEPLKTPKLPYLSSALLLQNDVQYLPSGMIDDKILIDSSIDNSNCFSVIQLSQTGALYKQTFYHADQTNAPMPKYKHLELFDMQFVDMPKSVATFQHMADKDLGTVPELRLKHYQSKSFEKLWNYISKDFKSSENNYSLKTLNLNYDTSFSKWEDVEKFFKEYGNKLGFNCHRRLILTDTNGNVTLAKFKCTEVDYDPKITKFSRFSPCEWSATLSHSRTHNSIIVANLNKQHNHDLFSPLYYSERWESGAADYLSNNSNWFLTSLASLDHRTEYKARDTINTLINNKINLVHDRINKSLHPSTIYEILKNIRSSYDVSTRSNSEIIRNQHFSENFRLIDDESEEIIMIDWTSANMDEMSTMPQGISLSGTIISPYGFPFNKINKHHNNSINDTLTELKNILKEAYPLPIMNENNFNDCFKQGKIVDTDLDLESQSFRNHAIDEVARDMTYSSIMYTSNLQNSSRFLYSSVVGDSKMGSTDVDRSSFPLIFTNNKVLDEEKKIIFNPIAEAIFDSWVIGEDYTKFQYEYP
ncbi:6326_t:CDS:10 [Entrophospora sp. SA101]|nr:6326_t:CDS:10 [Entrophospora sp. SA101]